MKVSAVHRFAGLDPWDHLAREESWFEDLPPGTTVLLLYVNSPCVVLGKHQNPLREVRLEEAFRRGVPLVRRSSGGGTVWHDGGNLNWSFLMPKADYHREHVSLAVAGAMSSLGFSLTIGEKGDLFLGDKKVSGAAYHFGRDTVLHHGTLLCQARLKDLHGVLGPTGFLRDWVGVASRPMPVTNLGVTVEAAAEALISSLAPGRAVGEGRGAPDWEARVAERVRVLKSPQWLWDRTPPFTWEGETSLGTLGFRVREGLIEEVLGDRTENMSNMVGKSFFDPAFFPYLSREVV